MPSQWTKEDSMKMDTAAGEAETDLRAKLESMKAAGQEMSAKQLLCWWNKWLMKAGHKRLYRIADRLL